MITMKTTEFLKKSRWFWAFFVLKKLFLAAFLLVPTYIFADDTAILDQIEKTNTAVKTLTSPFTQVKTSASNGATKHLAGTLYYATPDKVAQHYTQPATDLFLINGDKLYMARNGKKLQFDTSKNAPMRALRNTLIYCIQGRVRTLAAENEADIAVATDAKHYIVTLTSKKRVPRGYKKIVLHYAKTDGTLHTMQMDEINGNSTLYTMTAYKIGAAVDAKQFEIPAK